jgi:hypothetical protein
MALGGMTAVMDQLVAGARSLRDSTFNTLDAVQRQTTAARDELAERVQTFNRERADALQEQAKAVTVRDTRFDPEDEWEVSGPALAAGGQRRAAAPSVPSSQSRARQDDEDDYPDTWLR